jgi:hypothetical protein
MPNNATHLRIHRRSKNLQNLHIKFWWKKNSFLIKVCDSSVDIVVAVGWMVPRYVKN